MKTSVSRPLRIRWKKATNITRLMSQKPDLYNARHMYGRSQIQRLIKCYKNSTSNRNQFKMGERHFLSIKMVRPLTWPIPTPTRIQRALPFGRLLSAGGDFLPAGTCSCIGGGGGGLYMGFKRMGGKWLFGWCKLFYATKMTPFDGHNWRGSRWRWGRDGSCGKLGFISKPLRRTPFCQRRIPICQKMDT